MSNGAKEHARVVWLLIPIVYIGLLGISLYLYVLQNQEHYVEEEQEQDPVSYQVKEFPGFLTPEECDALKEIAKRFKFEDSSLYTGLETGDAIDTTQRQSKQTWLKDEDDALVAEISERVAGITGYPVSHQEQLQVVQYGVGGKYDPHYDACNENPKERCDRLNGRSGQRVLTFLIYLNDGSEMEGGGTRFPNIGKTVFPEKGKGILFENVYAGTEQVIPQSLHGGDPVIKGEKWIANKWIHQGPYSGK